MPKLILVAFVITGFIVNVSPGQESPAARCEVHTSASESDGQQPTSTSNEGPATPQHFISRIDKKIPQLLNDFSVPGAAIGIIEDGEIILQKGYGLADVENNATVTTTTGFNIGSVSKTVAAWGIMKLVQEGKIELDAPAEKYLSRWHLPESAFDANEVTIRRLLSHTAGLSLHGYPGWAPDEELPTIEESLNGKNNGPGRVEIIMAPGSQYKYSGGGFTILQLIIEEVTGQKFQDYMQDQILNPLGMTNSSYNIDDAIMAASAAEYGKFGERIAFELFTAQAAAGLHTTIEDFTRFALANLHQSRDFEKHNSVLPANVLEQMMKPVPQAKGRYGYGMGYFAESIPGTSVILGGHRGANDGWHAIFNVNPATNDGFVMLTNGGDGQKVYSPIYYDWVFWKLGVELEKWHNAKPPVSKKLKSMVDHTGISNARSAYQELKTTQLDKYDFAENHLNELGYFYLARDEVDSAIEIFKLNIEAFPNAANPYDSYAEALLRAGRKEESIANYKKSLELDSRNPGAVRVLSDLGVDVDIDPYFVESVELSSNKGPQVITRNILQDSEGDFWLATWNGIMLYDGTTFTNVTNKEQLRRYRTFSLLQDHQNNIWLGTTGAGVYRYDGQTYTNFTTDDGLSDNGILSMMQDADNNIWFGGMGLTKYDGSSFTSFAEKDGFTGAEVGSITQAPDGTIWFGTRGALFQFDGKSFVDFTKANQVDIEKKQLRPGIDRPPGPSLVWRFPRTVSLRWRGGAARLSASMFLAFRRFARQNLV